MSTATWACPKCSRTIVLSEPGLTCPWCALATAEALALTNGERADEWERRARNANDEWQSAMRLQGSAMSRASRAEAGRDELQRRLDAAITPYDPATAHALAAVRTERDELRGLLLTGARLANSFADCKDSDDELAVIELLTTWAAAIPEGTPGKGTP